MDYLALRDPSKFRAELAEDFLTNPHIHLFQFVMILEAHRNPDLRPAVHRLYQRYLEAFASTSNGQETRGNTPLNRARFAALDGLLIQYLAHAITQDEFLESLEALAQKATDVATSILGADQ